LYLKGMKYLIITGIFITGLSLGYVAGTRSVFSDDQDSTGHIGESNLVAGNDSSSKTDRENNDHEDESDQELIENDTNTVAENDSLLVEFMYTDTAHSEDHISTEKLMKAVYIPIVYLSEEVEKDTTIKEILGIEEVQNKTMFVEFWESPLNFEGYKLSKKKLIVYGLSAQFDYKIYKDEATYFFSYQSIYYKMKETQDFLPFVEVSKGDVFHD